MKEDDFAQKKVIQTVVETMGLALHIDTAILCLQQTQSDRSKSFAYCRRGWQKVDSRWLKSKAQVLQQQISALEAIAVEQRCGDLSGLLIPLIFQHQTIAVLALYRGDNTGWQAEEIGLAKIMSKQAALILSQIQAYERAKALAKREATINSVTRAIRSSLEPQAIFEAIVRELGQTLAVDGCTLSLWTKEDFFMRCVGLYNPAEARDKKLPKLADLICSADSSVPIRDNPILQKLLITKKPVVLDDLNRNQDLAQHQLPLHITAQALLIVPLLIEGKIIGSITLRQTQHARRWHTSDIELAETVASQAAIAVQQARLYATTRKQAQQLRESEQKVKQLNNYLTESVLKRFLPEAIVNKAAVGDLQLDLTPEPHLVTVLFCDLVDFTPLSSRLGARRISQLLNEHLEAMSKAVFDHGGTVDKFIGDAVMALFGAPELLNPQEQSQRAIATARAMHRYLDKLNQSWHKRGILSDTTLKLRCGIHQGSAVVGMFGGGQRTDYTAIGSTVNIAARLQQAAAPNSLLVSGTVAYFLDKREIKQIQSLKIKGIDRDVYTFAVSI